MKLELTNDRQKRSPLSLWSSAWSSITDTHKKNKTVRHKRNALRGRKETLRHRQAAITSTPHSTDRITMSLCPVLYSRGPFRCWLTTSSGQWIQHHGQLNRDVERAKMDLIKFNRTLYLCYKVKGWYQSLVPVTSPSGNLCFYHRPNPRDTTEERN